MKTIVETLQEHIERVQTIQTFLASLGDALDGWHMVSVGSYSPGLLQLFRRNDPKTGERDLKIDPKVIARAIGINWTRSGSSWEGKLACDDRINVILHDAEPSKPKPEAVEL